ncbi:probable serine/threonine-protein kinase At1g54610 isoform X1 [Typha latifolia]|uniref:probable serine/threonine-protein kinase At1g54610 isoform X1 n=1 Tax=Typha latifolia TaxID=4733 RepID=UPI003C2EB205
MGGICSKGLADENIKSLTTSRSIKLLVSLSGKHEVVVNNGSAARVNSKPKDVIPMGLPLDEGKKKAAGIDGAGNGTGHQRSATMYAGRADDLDPRVADGADEAKPHLDIVDVPNGFSGEHVIAGWPSWLTDVAGEAVKGWLPRRADSFEKLDKIGQGTYSNVYKARDLETGKIVALKKVRFVKMDPESVRFMAREIHILRSLDHPNVIKLEGIVASRMSGSLYLVFEYMEHDLSGLAATPGVKFTESEVKCYMQQLFRGLEHCHNRGVLHRDIKGSNLLIDNNGILRIGDFGLATFFDPNKRQPLTSRVVTLWYRPPELLLGATEYGVAVDLWSTGCILGELLVGKPIMPGRTEVEQLHKIFKLCGSPSDEYWKKSKLPDATIFKPQHQYRRCVAETFKDLPPSALALLDSLLAIEPAERGTATYALQSEFFRTKPLACDPSSLPKFPPSKEYDAKLRNEESRRQKTVAVYGREPEPARPGRKNSKGVSIPDANVEIQKRQIQANAKSNSEKYNPQEDSGSGFPIEPPQLPTAMHTNGFGSSWYKGNQNDHRRVPGRTYSSVRVPNGPQLRKQTSFIPQSGGTDLSMGARGNTNSRYNRLDAAEPSEKQVLDGPSSSHKKDLGTKDLTVGYGSKNRRIHYSGPLMPPGGNVEDMLKEHERQIQQAVRKARLEKDKTKKNFF